MKIHLLAVGKKMPLWVAQGYAEYAKRLPRECGLQLQEIAAAKRAKTFDRNKVLQQEGQALLKATPADAHVIVLDKQGCNWSTEQLAARLHTWLAAGRDIALLVGGAEGMARECYTRANEKWSLSALTLPHPLVRIVVAEALYRAWSYMQGHPYHRADANIERA